MFHWCGASEEGGAIAPSLETGQKYTPATHDVHPQFERCDAVGIGVSNTQLEHFADRVPGPDHIAATRSNLAAVERAMKRLRPRHRAVLVALRIDELTYHEVAARYQLSLRGGDIALRQAVDHLAQLTGNSVGHAGN